MSALYACRLFESALRSRPGVGGSREGSNKVALGTQPVVQVVAMLATALLMQFVGPCSDVVLGYSDLSSSVMPRAKRHDRVRLARRLTGADTNETRWLGSHAHPRRAMSRLTVLDGATPTAGIATKLEPLGRRH